MDCEDNKREYLMELLTAFRYINITILYGLELCGSWEKFKFVDMRKENTLLKSQEKITFVVLKTNNVFFSIVRPVVVFFFNLIGSIQVRSTGCCTFCSKHLKEAYEEQRI